MVKTPLTTYQKSSYPRWDQSHPRREDHSTFVVEVIRAGAPGSLIDAVRNKLKRGGTPAEPPIPAEPQPAAAPQKGVSHESVSVSEPGQRPLCWNQH